MVVNMKLLVALLLLVLISACEDGPKTCPLFEHPSEAIWDPAIPGDVVVFSNQLGNEVRYELKNTIDDKATAVPDRASCVSRSISKYYSDDSNVGFDVIFEHIHPDDDGELVPLAEQFLTYGLEVVKEDMTFGGRVKFLVSTLDSPYNTDAKDIGVCQYFPARTINGKEFVDLLERDISGYEDIVTYLADYPEDVAWVRMVIAKGVGLLQYELLNGEIYTRQN